MRKHIVLRTVAAVAVSCALVPVQSIAFAVGGTTADADNAQLVDLTQEAAHTEQGSSSETQEGASTTATELQTDQSGVAPEAQVNVSATSEGASLEQNLGEADSTSSAAEPSKTVEAAEGTGDAVDTKGTVEEQRDEEGGEQQADEIAPELLSDAELDALVVELDESELLEYSEGDIALRAQATSGWRRVAGSIALDTMQKVLQIGTFPSGRGGDVIVATADGYWDALAAAGLAGTLHAPIVLTSTTTLSAQAQSEIARLRPSRLIVMGGNVAVSDSVENALKSLAPSVVRVAGPRACDTALAGYRLGKGWGKTAIVATCDGYWDALSIAPYAYWAQAPIFLTNGDKVLNDDVRDALRSGQFSRVIIVGGPAAVSNTVESQLSGMNVKRLQGPIALDTSAEIAKWAVDEGMKLTHLTVATSEGYWDALSAAPVCGELASVLVLVSPKGDYRALDAVYSYAPGSVELGYIIGGPMAIPETIEQRVTADWAIKSLNLSATAVRAGGSVTLNPQLITGGSPLSSFSYRYSWSGGGGSGADSNFSGDKSRSFKLSNPGIYDVAVEVSGPDGAKQKLSSKVSVYALNGLSVSSNNRHSWRLNADLGLSGNGASGVEFRFTWKSNGSGASGVIRDWSSSPSTDVDVKQMQGSAYNYTVTVEARDGQGSLGSRSADITPSRSLDIEWAGQPNNYYCGPTAGFMILRNAGAWSSSADGSSLTIGNVAGAMGTSYYGYTSFTDRMFERGMNSWLGSNVYTTIDNPSYDTVRDAIFRSFDTGYAVAFDAHEVSGGWHYNGHNDATFSHILVVDAYNPDNDTVLLVDPGAGVLWGGASQKFWYSLRDFVNIYLAPAYWRDGIGMICPR